MTIKKAIVLAAATALLTSGCMTQVEVRIGPKANTTSGVTRVQADPATQQ